MGITQKRLLEIFQIKRRKFINDSEISYEKIKLFKKYGRLGESQKTHLGIDMRCTQVTAPVF